MRIEKILNLSNQIGIFEKDKNLKYTFCNDFIAELIGLDSPKQIIGKIDSDFTVWKPFESQYRNDDLNTLQGQFLINGKRFRQEGEKIKTLLVSKVMLTDHDGYPSGVAGHSIDITGYSITKRNGYFNPQRNTFLLGEQFNNEYLTRRELEVFRYLLAGKSVEEIAFELMRSPKTVQSQIKSIANKLQCSHKSEIVPAAIQYGLTHVMDDISLEKIN